MDTKKLRALVERIILCKLAESGERFVPVASSNRHVHLCQNDVDILFSPGYSLKKLRGLSQTGQYACKETVVLETPKGRLPLRVLGPVRKETQVELSVADMVSLKIPPVVRMSGETSGTPGGKLVHGDKSLDLKQGMIVARRHIHMSLLEAEAFGVKDGSLVSLVSEGARPTVFRDVVVRTDKSFTLEAHLDRDEANAAALADGALCRLLLQEEGTREKDLAEQAASDQVFHKPRVSKLITEDDVKAAQRAGARTIEHTKNTIITPLAKDAARQYGITLSDGGIL